MTQAAAQGWSGRYGEAEPQRVNRWLAQAGVCSRREAEALIAAGRVWIDGERVEDAGRKIAPGQALEVRPTGDAEAGGPLSLVVNKPPGYVSAQPEHGQVPAARLLTPAALWGGPGPKVAADASLAPLGRLDLESQGLLILSQDGVLAKALIGPASTLDKEYRVRVTGEVTLAALERLRFGLELDGRQLKRAEVGVLAPQVLRFVLHEGRNRQIRRMAEAVDLRVVSLQRLRIGPLRLGELPLGRWRPLSPAERAALLAPPAPGAGGR